MFFLSWFLSNFFVAHAGLLEPSLKIPPPEEAIQVELLMSVNPESRFALARPVGWLCRRDSSKGKKKKKQSLGDLVKNDKLFYLVLPLPFFLLFILVVQYVSLFVAATWSRSTYTGTKQACSCFLLLLMHTSGLCIALGHGF